MRQLPPSSILTAIKKSTCALAAVFMLAASCGPAPNHGDTGPSTATPDASNEMKNHEFLQVRGPELYLHGKPNLTHWWT